MKKILTAIWVTTLAAVMLVSFTACSKKKTDGTKLIVGELTKPGQTEAELTEDANKSTGKDHEFIYFDDLTSMLQALQSGRIQRFGICKSVANYIVKNNSELKLGISQGKIKSMVSLSIAVKDSDTELQSTLNTAIKALKADGTIDALYKQYVTDTSSDATPMDLPKNDSAKTVRVVVTGDLPPLDFVTADGKPAGFNVALLSAIGEKANLNFELVTSNAASRTTLLASGKADTIFWMRENCIQDKDCNILHKHSEVPSGIIITESYLTEESVQLEKK